MHVWRSWTPGTVQYTANACNCPSHMRACMQGFLNLSLPMWLRVLVTRLASLLPLLMLSLSLSDDGLQDVAGVVNVVQVGPAGGAEERGEMRNYAGMHACYGLGGEWRAWWMCMWGELLWVS
jgi:hypothetical protein